MKIKRTTKDYGSGSGRVTSESDLFCVTLWNSHYGINTKIMCKLGIHTEIHFDGEHKFTTDDSCIEQFTASEILEIINYQKEEAFEAGEKSKIKELKNCLEIY